jgi:NAD(P)-dependent dehydrogenase (short-subunit alcohol dehydrogenase family)
MSKTGDPLGATMTGRVVLVTGASSGIGEATAVIFAQLNAQVSLTGRNEQNLEETVKKCVSAGAKAENIFTVAGDLTNQEDVERIVNATIAKFGKLDVLVNNAGIVVFGDVIDAPVDDYDKVMNINVRSIIALTKAFLPHIIAAKGTIVNVSSVNGICAFPSLTYYCMSKAALDQFTKCLALEMAPNGVRVNAVNPGVIVTNIQRNAGMEDKEIDAFIEHSKTTHALGRVGTIEEVAKSIAFLASDASSYTTGQLLKVEGGRAIISPY